MLEVFPPLNGDFSFSNTEKAECVFLLITVYTVQKLNADVFYNYSDILLLLKIWTDHAYLLNTFFGLLIFKFFKKVGVLSHFVD